MWVKRTEQELLELERKKKRSRPRGAIFLGISVFCIVLFLKTPEETGDIPHLTRAYELPSLFPFAIVWGLVVGLVFYFFPKRDRPVVLCNRCGKSKDKDSETKCSCGGTFEDIRTMKWQEDIK